MISHKQSDTNVSKISVTFKTFVELKNIAKQISICLLERT